MTVLLAAVIGVLYTFGIYLMLRRNVVRLVFGLVLLGHAANLLIFTAGGQLVMAVQQCSVDVDGK